VRVRERIRNKLYAKKHVQQSDATKDEDADLQQIIETEAEREHNEQRYYLDKTTFEYIN
jgi:hypothetical protein